MNCHGNHDNKNGENGKGHRGHLSHMLMMALCCGAPIMILLLIPLISKVGGAGTARFLAAAAPFLCPLMMVGMLPMMLKGGKNKGKKCCNEASEQSQLEEKKIV